MSREDVLQLFRFIDWMMDLPEVHDNLFWQEVHQIEEEKRMPFMTTPERVGLKRGLMAGIEKCLKVRFGEAGLQLVPEIREIVELHVLQAVLDAIDTVSSPQELRRIWSGQEEPKGSDSASM